MQNLFSLVLQFSNLLSKQFWMTYYKMSSKPILNDSVHNWWLCFNNFQTRKHNYLLSLRDPTILVYVLSGPSPYLSYSFFFFLFCGLLASPLEGGRIREIIQFWYQKAILFYWEQRLKRTIKTGFLGTKTGYNRK